MFSLIIAYHFLSFLSHLNDSKSKWGRLAQYTNRPFSNIFLLGFQIFLGLVTNLCILLRKEIIISTKIIIIPQKQDR